MEGTYLIVNKNLIEAAAVGVLFAFRTGRIAGLDALRRRTARPVVMGDVPVSHRPAGPAAPPS